MIASPATAAPTPIPAVAPLDKSELSERVEVGELLMKEVEVSPYVVPVVVVLAGRLPPA